MSEPNLIVKSSSLGPLIIPEGLSSFPHRMRDLCNAEWELFPGGESDCYTRVPVSGCPLDEFPNSYCEPWGASRTNPTASGVSPAPFLVNVSIGSPGGSFQDWLQRWTFLHDFECYGMTVPLRSLTSNTTLTLSIKFALFQVFPYTNTTQAWKVLPGAKFKIEESITQTAGTGPIRKLYVPFDPLNGGSIIIPAGLYYLFILPYGPFDGSFFGRFPRDYGIDTANIWRGDRSRSTAQTGITNWSTYDYSTLVFDNDATAPPIGSSNVAYDTSTLAPTNYWPLIDFAFYGRRI